MIDPKIEFELILCMQAVYSSAPDSKTKFCTYNPLLQGAANKLISEGFIVESEGSGGLDRVYEFTDLGKSKYL